MAPADRQLAIILVVGRLSKDNPCPAICRLLEPVDFVDGDERTAVNAYKIIRKLLFEGFQRIIDQVLALTVVYANVLLIGIEVADFIDRD